MNKETAAKKNILLTQCVPDAISDLLCYNRIDDDDLDREDVEFLLSRGHVTEEEILEAFRGSLTKVIRANCPDVAYKERREEY